ncbi:uncharacterized protein MONBRDRAFT_37774 [Monosiga brevicollis MX1]|uniref:Elongation of fatty acids protein n=1 Tax=Monosiga brevicollis TaxID=81824 RepID=A9V3Y1_MONBE|nr:uncharacterized protein MONBRDRAFT_37774 [Monosiga brevicollis MX1]EDQ87885.1 predicted protein [Monosiga brevicollis MX1]|eukprot:XP_001747418.1 hypothetical protein [Monosiga brevicollis MX1]
MDAAQVDAMKQMVLTETADAAVYGPLVEPAVLVASGALYVIAALLLHKTMRNQKPMDLKGLMRVYNLVQVAVCGYMTYGLVQELFKADMINVFGLFSLPNVFGLNLAFDRRAEYFVLIHYLSKFLDFFDTLFIVLRKKDAQFSFLHVYHHATIGPIWGLLLYLGYGSGTAIFGAMINSMTHVIMYSHYFVTSFGINNPLKKYITTWQICQFYSCLMHAVVLVFSGLDTIYPPYLAWLQFGYHITMVALFTQFYNKNFKKGGAAAKAAAGKSSVKQTGTVAAEFALNNNVHANETGVAARRRRKAEQ